MSAAPRYNPSAPAVKRILQVRLERECGACVCVVTGWRREGQRPERRLRKNGHPLASVFIDQPLHVPLPAGDQRNRARRRRRPGGRSAGGERRCGGGGEPEKKTPDPNPLRPSLFFPTPLSQDDIFQWFFAIRGARGSDFDGGIYVGRILLPPEFPMRPPSFVLLTPSGRFETGVKICLSISQFHEQDGLWSPSWSIRTALVALIPFFDTPGGGAIGALDWSPADRRDLAAKAAAAPPEAGLGPERQAVIDRLHAKLKARMVEEREKERAAGQDEGAAASQPAAAAEPAAATAAGDGLRQRAVPAATAATPPAAPAPAPRRPTAAAEWEDALLTVVAALLVLLIGVCLARSVLRTMGAAVSV